MALVAGAPDPGLADGQLVEPTIGVGGYTDKNLDADSLDWDTEGS
jgi:hypothetical protein